MDTTVDQLLLSGLSLLKSPLLPNFSEVISIPATPDFSEAPCSHPHGPRFPGALLPTGQVRELWEEVFHGLFFKLMQPLVLGEPRPTPTQPPTWESVAGLTPSTSQWQPGQGPAHRASLCLTSLYR